MKPALSTTEQAEALGLSSEEFLRVISAWQSRSRRDDGPGPALGPPLARGLKTHEPEFRRRSEAIVDLVIRNDHLRPRPKAWGSQGLSTLLILLLGLASVLELWVWPFDPLGALLFVPLVLAIFKQSRAQAAFQADHPRRAAVRQAVEQLLQGPHTMRPFLPPGWTSDPDDPWEGRGEA